MNIIGFFYFWLNHKQSQQIKIGTFYVNNVFVYEPVLFDLSSSVIIFKPQTEPYFVNSCLTSWYRLMRGTPKTSKCLDSFTIVYTWKQILTGNNLEWNSSQTFFIRNFYSLWLPLAFVHRDILVDLYNMLSVCGVISLLLQNFP